MPRTSAWSRQLVRSTAAAQHGLITAQQLSDLGVPRSTVARNAELGGMFSWVLPGVHRVDRRGELSEDERDMAALLYAGRGATLTGVSSLRRLGIAASRLAALDPERRAHVLIEHERRRASHLFVQVERSVVPVRTWERDGFPVAAPARAVVDACRRCSDEAAVRALVLEILQRGLTTVDALDAERRRGQIRGSRFLRLSLDEARSGVASPPEADLRRAFVAAGWTRLLFNPDLELPDGRFLARPDVYDPMTGTCLEVDSRAHHFEPASWEATMERHGRMTATGLAVLHVPPSRIASRVADVVGEFDRTVSARSEYPPPRVLVRPRPVARR